MRRIFLAVVVFLAEVCYSWRVSQCNDKLGNIVNCEHPKNEICYKKESNGVIIEAGCALCNIIDMNYFGMIVRYNKGLILGEICASMWLERGKKNLTSISLN